MEDKDEVQSRSESSPSKEPSYQEPLVEENLMKIESNTNKRKRSTLVGST